MWYNKDSENQAPIKQAAELLTNKKYAEAEIATRALLGKRLSMWQRVYRTAMLADCLEDWYEAEVSKQTDIITITKPANTYVGAALPC